MRTSCCCNVCVGVCGVVVGVGVCVGGGAGGGAPSVCLLRKTRKEAEASKRIGHAGRAAAKPPLLKGLPSEREASPVGCPVLLLRVKMRETEGLLLRNAGGCEKAACCGAVALRAAVPAVPVHATRQQGVRRAQPCCALPVAQSFPTPKLS